MTDQEKKKLLIALSGYYPHGVIVEIEGYGIHKLKGIDNGTISTDRGINYPLRLVKPFLRTMDSMTEKEKEHDIKEAYHLLLNVLEDTDEETWAYYYLSKARDSLYDWFEEEEI